MSRRLLAETALVDGAIREHVSIGIAADGRISDLAFSAPPEAGSEPVAGLVVPGIANVHSHAFQRAMAGLAETAGPEGDNFWRWREVMYRFLATLSPDDVEAIAAQLYAECLRHGYTAVAEFHYLHNAPDGSPYDDPAELSLRIVAAAESAGIGLTLLPVLYRRGGFGGAAATSGQRRFLMDLDRFAALVQSLRSVANLGVAPHSLRAVTPEEFSAAVEIAFSLGPETRLHIHVAEQVGEVEDCLAWSGRRPVQWLMEHVDIGPRWCLIHATHLTETEIFAMAASGAIAGLCQTTEANLGDGLFPLRAFLAGGGRFGVGSDSNVGTSPVEELRWMEYARRLDTRARNVSETRPGASVAAGLLAHAARDGAAALGRDAGEIAVGKSADLVVLDTDHPALVGRRGEAFLDAWVFSGNATPVRHVMVAGRWVVRDGAHVRGPRIQQKFAATMRKLLAC